MRFLSILLSALLFSLSCNYENPIVKWEDGDIPYYYSGEFSDEDIMIVEQAMKQWENSCGVMFHEVLPRSNAYEIIRVNNSNEWASSIGENNVFNHMYYGDGSGELGHVLHELGHCLGLIHEHQRPDRDSYVTIAWDNIWPEYEHNFEMRDNPLIQESDFPYDYNSIMHYHPTGFSINGEETIIPNPPYTIQRTDALTEYDKTKARAIYGPPFED